MSLCVCGVCIELTQKINERNMKLQIERKKKQNSGIETNV